MLRLAQVGAGDVVFDLGSGDGRLVIAAARDFGARGVGVEIDAPLVQRSREAALAAGVADRVEFLWQDLFVTDIRPATVVTLYLRDDVNLRLRPKLLAELRPGTRVVSHDFGMGDWRPDHRQRVRVPDREHTVYLWLVPADAAGAWRLAVAGPGRPRDGRLGLTQRYQAVEGTLTLDGRDVPVRDGRLAGDGIAFAAGDLAFTGRVAGDAMEGTAVAPGAPPAAWTARRAR
jgi:SAM-dependent methyltransferase